MVVSKRHSYITAFTAFAADTALNARAILSAKSHPSPATDELVSKFATAEQATAKKRQKQGKLLQEKASAASSDVLASKAVTPATSKLAAPKPSIARYFYIS